MARADAAKAEGRAKRAACRGVRGTSILLSFFLASMLITLYFLACARKRDPELFQRRLDRRRSLGWSWPEAAGFARREALLRFGFS